MVRTDLVLAAVILFLALVAVATTNGASRGFETFEQIKNRWSAVSPDELRKAAENGQADAQYFLAVTEWNAALDEVNVAGERWRSRSRTNTARLSPAERLNTTIRTNWEGVAEQEIQRAAESGDRGAQQYFIGIASHKAAERGRNAFEWMKKAAAQNVVPAEYDLAVRYLGQGWQIVPLDPAEGLKWLRKAAEDGHPNAQNRLAEMLIGGGEMPADLPAAIEWLRRAADHGLPRAQFNLAQQYACGHGEPRTTGETPAALFQKAAETGLQDAQFALAERYRTGLGVPQDYIEAAAWYRRAASTSHVDRASSLVSIRRVSAPVNQRGEIARADDMGDPRFIEALQLYLKAVNLRDAEAQGKIGDFYSRNREAEHRQAKAFFWYGLAAERGSPQAAEKRDQLKAFLTPDDHRRIEEWTKEFNRPSK